MENIILRKYRLLEEIGRGSFGVVHRGIHIKKNMEVAIKIEEVNADIALLHNETQIYHYLSNIVGVPSLKWFGVENGKRYMVSELLGESLQIVKNRDYKKGMTANMVSCFAISALDIISNLHYKELLHRDIKPDNFLSGTKIDSTLPECVTAPHLIDFGISTTYTNEQGEHIEETKTKGLIGTPNYASIQSHSRMEMGRRDDLESLGYVLLYLLTNELQLPWCKLKEETLIFQKKKEFRKQIMDHHTNNIPIVQYFKKVYLLSYKQEPDYQNLASIFYIE
jgi:casein kinase I family protein HRR25